MGDGVPCHGALEIVGLLLLLLLTCTLKMQLASFMHFCFIKARQIVWRRTWLKDAHEETEQGVVKEDVGEKLSASGRDYISMWQ